MRPIYDTLLVETYGSPIRTIHTPKETLIRWNETYIRHIARWDRWLANLRNIFNQKSHQFALKSPECTQKSSKYAQQRPDTTHFNNTLLRHTSTTHFNYTLLRHTLTTHVYDTLPQGGRPHCDLMVRLHYDLIVETFASPICTISTMQEPYEGLTEAYIWHIARRDRWLANLRNIYTKRAINTLKRGLYTAHCLSRPLARQSAQHIHQKSQTYAQKTPESAQKRPKYAVKRPLARPSAQNIHQKIHKCAYTSP